MPCIIITGPKIGEVEKKRVLTDRMAQMAAVNYNVPKDEVGVFIVELPNENVAPGGVLVSDHDPRQDKELLTHAHMVFAEVEGPPMNDENNDKKRAVVKEVTEAVTDAYSISSPRHLTIRITENPGNIIGNGGVLLIDR